MGKAEQIAAGWRSLNALVDKFREDENGATAIEYGLIVALIFLAIVAAVNNYTSKTNDMYNDIANAVG